MGGLCNIAAICCASVLAQGGQGTEESTPISVSFNPITVTVELAVAFG